MPNEKKNEINRLLKEINKILDAMNAVFEALESNAEKQCKCHCKNAPKAVKAPKWFNLVEISKMCSVSTRTAERWAKNGAFKESKKTKAGWFVKATDDDLLKLASKKGKKKCSAK